jgi:hypothetical protein
MPKCVKTIVLTTKSHFMIRSKMVDVHASIRFLQLGLLGDDILSNQARTGDVEVMIIPVQNACGISHATLLSVAKRLFQ